MNKTLRRTLIAGAIVTGAFMDSPPISKAAPADGSGRFQRAPVQGRLNSNVKPRALENDEVTVVALLGGATVADAQEAAGRRLTRQEKMAIKAQRRAEQVGPRAAIEAIGGHVITTFQSALNGIKVRIARDQIAALRQVPGVVDVKPVNIYTHENVVGIPRIQAPIAWSGVAGFHGEGVKVAIVDTGIDYTHADFGGPGTPAAYQAALAADTAPADPALFGPNAPKVKGGTDLVGDDYNASDPAHQVPAPDPNPLDCNGHGTHVSGTAAGFGVLADGSTFTGTYDQTTIPSHSFNVGPGVAPLADLYAVRVFGCAGSTNVVPEALEWAVDNDMDVVNMSLGANFGSADSADALASDNAVKAGVNVVVAAGNAGNIRYVTGSPGVSSKVITAAATVAPAFYPTVNLALPAVPGVAAKTINGINANGIPVPPILPAQVLRNPNGTVSLGCNPQDYVDQNVAGKIVVVVRGTCARVARAIFGQKAGAAAVVMINNATTLPPFEGAITSNPDTGEPYVVTIPFLGVRGLATSASSDGFALVQRDGVSISLSAGLPIQTGLADFTSGGPRLPDSHLKPDVAAPGVNIVSAGVGSGNGSLTASGTSMATPHTTGTAALAVQAHPTWKPAAIKSAIINSGNPGGLSDYSARRAGSGIINAASAAGSLTYAYADKDETTLNFGLDQFKTDLTRTGMIHVKNTGSTAVTFNVGVTNQQGSPHTVALSVPQVTVPAHGQASVQVSLTLPAATAGNSLPSPGGDAFRDAAGIIAITPTPASANRGFTLRVPYYLVPRVSSNVTAMLPKLKGTPPTGNATLQNAGSPISATADFYAWGLDSPNDGLGRFDLRAAGVQSFDAGGGDRVVVIAINTFKAWATPETQEFDVAVDVNGDGHPDFIVFNVDLGLITTGAFNGQVVAAIANLSTGNLAADFYAVAPTNGSTILLPVLASDIGVTAANPRFAYNVTAFDLESDGTDQFTASASFNAFNSAISNGQFEVVAPDASVGVPVSVDSAEFAITPALGLMIVTQDDKNGAAEANLVKVKF
jgi:minor extracellular serine protease Vpr